MQIRGKIVNYCFFLDYPAQSSLSRFLYPMASAKCEGCIRSLFSRSAMVRATFKIRLCALALKPRLSNAARKIAFSSSPSGQNFLSIPASSCEFE